MKFVLCDITAYQYWNAQLAAGKNVPGYARIAVPNDPPTGPEWGHAAAWCETKRLEPPFHVLVSSASARRDKANVVCHTETHELPQRALCKIRDGLYVTSPDYTFVQMALHMSTIELVRFGYQLCARFAPTEFSPIGQIDRDPLTTAKQLRGFAEQLEGVRGGRGAALAAKHVFDNARSVREIQLHMLLCLPARLGGYGIKPAHLNPEITLTPELQASTKMKYVSPDLYWLDSRVDVEYDSKLAHNNDAARKHDAKRRNAIRDLGITVIEANNDHVVRPEETHDLAVQIANAIGMRVRPGQFDLTKKRMSLRNFLLHESSRSDNAAF